MNVIEPRTMFGYPILPSKLDRAQQYAAEVRARNKPPCQCQVCREAETLPAVMNIVAAWKKQ